MQKREAIEKYMEAYGGDGHSIIKAEALVKWGFDFEFVSNLAFNHESGEHFKEMIFSPDFSKKLDSLYGVYSLSFAYAIAHDIGASTKEAREKMGRGFQAGCLNASIRQRLAELTDIKNQETGEMEMADLGDENHPVWKE